MEIGCLFVATRKKGRPVILGIYTIMITINANLIPIVGIMVLSIKCITIKIKKI